MRHKNVGLNVGLSVGLKLFVEFGSRIAMEKLLKNRNGVMFHEINSDKRYNKRRKRRDNP